MQTLDFLNQHLYADRLRQPTFQFQLLQQRRVELHIRCRSRFRDHDGVKVLTGTFNHMNNILVTPRRIQGVHPHAANFRSPVVLGQRRDDIVAGIDFGIGCDRIFQIEEHMIRGARRSLAQHFRV